MLAVTLGDVAGIGPEITAKALLRHADLRNECVPVVIGDADAMRRASKRWAAIRTPSRSSRIRARRPTIPTASTHAGRAFAEAVRPGEQSGIAGDGAYRFVVEACRLAKAGKVNGIVTAPLNKAAMHEGGHNWPGHTELLAHEFGVKNFSLVLSAGDLYFFHLTTHVSLKKAIANITPERTDAMLDLADAFGRALGWTNEPIGLAGLNPHAGEGGLFGKEDAEVLAPATARAKRARPQRGRPAAGRCADSCGGERKVEAGGGLLSRSGTRTIQSRVR